MNTEKTDEDGFHGLKPVIPTRIAVGKTTSELLGDMARTGFQGRSLARCAQVWEAMLRDPDGTVLLGYAGSLSVAGQYEIVNWLLENGLVDVLVATGANLSEDIVDVMGAAYRQLDHCHSDDELFRRGTNRYYDLAGNEDDYLRMTELIAEFYQSFSGDGVPATTAYLLNQFGRWLNDRGMQRCIVATAYRMGVPVFCPAIQDSPYGDAALLAMSRGIATKVDAFQDYEAFMRLATKLTVTGVVYVGGGVPKDFIQLLAVTPGLLFASREVPGRGDGFCRHDGKADYYPHRYAVQITADSPQWGGLSGCTFDEAISWGKVAPDGQYAQCYCDATIALPIVCQALAERLAGFGRCARNLWQSDFS